MQRDHSTVVVICMIITAFCMALNALIWSPMQIHMYKEQIRMQQQAISQSHPAKGLTQL